MKKLDLNWSIYAIVKEYPEAIETMKELGFEEISKPAMLNTAGRVMTLPKGAAMRGIDLDKIKKAFKEKGFEIIG
jgi:predicted hydrolase (HD superfamily)